MPASDSRSTSAASKGPPREQPYGFEKPQSRDPLDDLVNSLEHRGIMAPNFEQIWTEILTTMRAESRRDPANFGRKVLDEAIAFAGYIALRGRHCTATRLADWDRSRRDQGRGGPDPVLDDRDLPRLLDLERHLADLIDARAATERKWALVQRGGRPTYETLENSRGQKDRPHDVEDDTEPSTNASWGPFDG